MEEKLTISGKIAADEDATLGFQTGGLLTWVGVKVGDHVKKYQGIASLDQRQVQKNIEKYLNTYEKTRDTFEGTQSTYKDQTLWTDPIRRILHDSQMDLSNSVLDVEIQDLARQLSRLTSPIDGIVVRVDTPLPGVNVTALTSLFEIVNPKTVYFSASADQTEVTKLRPTLTGELVLDSYPNATINGRIDRISFIPKSGTTDTVYEVKFLFDQPNDDYRFRIGMTGDVTFTTAKAVNTLYIPTKYIKSDGDKNYVNIIINNKKEKRFVTTGIETDENTEIKSGLSEGETVYE